MKYQETSIWYDYSKMVDANCDGVIYKENSGKYYVNIDYLERKELSVTLWGVKDNTDGTNAIQKALDSVLPGTTLSFKGLKKVFINSDGINLMRNKDWKQGYKATQRKNVVIDFAGCELCFLKSVPFKGVFHNQPIYHNTPLSAATHNRQPCLFIASFEDFTIKNVILNGNMQERAKVHGFPGQLEHEHCLLLVSCKDFIIDNIITKDSMGDGICINYPYSSGSSQFYGVNSLNGLCERFSITNHKAYRHSRLGIAVVGAKKGDFKNIYGEDIMNVPNFLSSGGPGAVVDVEYDTSKSYYNRRGFSVCEDFTFENIVARNCQYGGAFQVQNGRNITVSKIKMTGNSNYGVFRILASKDINEGAKNVTIKDVTVRDAPNCNFIGVVGGENITVDNLTLEGVGSTTGLRLDDNSKNITVRNVKASALKLTDPTGQLFMVGVSCKNIKIVNFIAELIPGSKARQIIFPLENSEVEVNGLNIYEKIPDSGTFYAKDRGIVGFEAAINSKVTVRNSTIDLKVLSLYSTSSTNNEIYFDNVIVRGTAYFPSIAMLKRVDLNRVQVISCWNNGDPSPSMLFIKYESGCHLSIRDAKISSNGLCGYNKAKNGVYLTASSFKEVYNFVVDIDGLELIGGRDKDGLCTPTAKNGLGESIEPWVNPRLIKMFKVKNVDINGSKGKVILLPSGASQYFIGGDFYSLNMCYLPGQKLEFEKLGQDGGGGVYSINHYRKGEEFTPSFSTIKFSKKLTSSQKIILK